MRISSSLLVTSSVDFVLAFSIELAGVNVAVDGVASVELPDMPVVDGVAVATVVPEPPYRGKSHSCCLSVKQEKYLSFHSQDKVKNVEYTMGKMKKK